MAALENKLEIKQLLKGSEKKSKEYKVDLDNDIKRAEKILKQLKHLKKNADARKREPAAAEKTQQCMAIFYRRVAPKDTGKIIEDKQRRKYRQIWSGHAGIRGDIMLYNNQRTYCPQKDDEDVEAQPATKAHWKSLIKILSTDVEIESLIDRILGSEDMHCIIIKNAVEAEPRRKLFQPLKRKFPRAHVSTQNVGKS